MLLEAAPEDTTDRVRVAAAIVATPACPREEAEGSVEVVEGALAVEAGGAGKRSRSPKEDHWTFI